MAADIKPASKPCAECPFLKTSLSGWLGGETDPTAYLQSLEHVEMACHMHYPEDRDAIPSNLAHEHPCIGALQLCANAMMFPRAARPKDIPGMIYNKHLDSVQKNDEVFKWKHEFIKHHNHEV